MSTSLAHLLEGELVWRHVTLSLKLTWRPGSPRGFRDHGHRIHSSGDYRNPPPSGEHAGLYRHSFKLNPGRPRSLRDVALRYAVLASLLAKLEELKVQAPVIAVCPQHAHFDALLPRSRSATKAIVGAAKQRASHDVRHWLEGSLWARGGSYKLIRDRSHQRATLNYIAFKQEPGTVVWSWRHGFFVLDENRRPRRLRDEKMALE